MAVKPTDAEITEAMHMCRAPESLRSIFEHPANQQALRDITAIGKKSLQNSSNTLFEELKNSTVYFKSIQYAAQNISEIPLTSQIGALLNSIGSLKSQEATGVVFTQDQLNTEKANLERISPGALTQICELYKDQYPALNTNPNLLYTAGENGLRDNFASFLQTAQANSAGIARTREMWFNNSVLDLSSKISALFEKMMEMISKITNKF